MPYSENKKKYNADYIKKNIKRVPLDMQKEKYEQVKAAADAAGESVNGYIKTAVDNRMSSPRSPAIIEDRWYGNIRSEEERQLADTLSKNEELFDDMLFHEGTITHDFALIPGSNDGGKTWYNIDTPLPDILEDFGPECCFLCVSNTEDGPLGSFDPSSLTITISLEELNNEYTILHEMIHMYEFALDQCQIFYHEACLWCIYKDLEQKIPDLDSQIREHGKPFVQHQFSSNYGTHDILFLLKSFDLDLKKGYKLGTVFGYGYEE